MMALSRKVRTMIGKALEMSGDMASLAEESGLSYDTLYSWRTGRTTPRMHNLMRLAEALRTRGQKLQEIALELEAYAAEQGEGEE